MIIYYRAIGLVACFALIYYTLVVVAIFRLVPVTLTLAGIAGFVLSVGMAVDANILIFERMKEELRIGKSLPAAVEAGFNRAWNSILDSNVSSLITATILYAFGSSVIRGFALVLIIGVLVSMFSAIVVTRSIMRVMVRQDWARRPSFYGLREDEFLARGSRPPRAAGGDRACLTSSANAGSFYAISLALTIPGLVFILLTPFTDLGLQFTIDYTGGTKWEIRFEDAGVTPDQVEAVFAEQGLDAVAITTGSGFIEIKTEPIGLVEAPAPAPSACPRRAVPVGRAECERETRSRPARPRRHRSAAPRRQHRAPDRPARSARSARPSRRSSGRSRHRTA